MQYSIVAPHGLRLASKRCCITNVEQNIRQFNYHGQELHNNTAISCDQYSELFPFHYSRPQKWNLSQRFSYTLVSQQIRISNPVAAG